jgi:oxygen-insensitive NAD(P)H nitroreductase
MDVLKMFRERYTTKLYDSSYRLQAEEIDQIKEILCLAPSSINSQPWAFEIIEDDVIKERLSEYSMNNRGRVRAASHIIVFHVYRSVEVFEQERISRLAEGAQGFYRGYVASRGELAVRAWMEHQVYVALGMLLAALPAMGIDSTPMEGIDLDAYDAILAHEKYRPIVAVALGRRDPKDENQPSITPKSRRTDVFL